MKQGDILLATDKTMTIGYAGIANGVLYNPWVDTTISGGIFSDGWTELPILEQLKLLDDSEPSDTPMNLFIGADTNPPQRSLKVEFKFGKTIGTFTGKVAYLNGTAYVQVKTQIRAYIKKKGDDYPVFASVWFRKQDVTDSQSELVDIADAESNPEVKKNLKKELTGNSDTGTGNGNGNSNNTIWYVVGAILLSLVGFFIWKSNKK